MRLNPKRRARRRQQLEIARMEKILAGPPEKKCAVEDVVWSPAIGIYNAKIEMYNAQVKIYDANVRAMLDKVRDTKEMTAYKVFKAGH